MHIYLLKFLQVNSLLTSSNAGAMQVGHLALLMLMDLILLLTDSLCVFLGSSQGVQWSKQWCEMFCDESMDQQSTYMLLTSVS